MTRVGRVQFVRHLYNLLCDVELDEDEDTRNATLQLNLSISNSPGMKTFHTKDETSNTGKKCRRTGDRGGADGRGGGGYEELSTWLR
jgi:hypothetical protein